MNATMSLDSLAGEAMRIFNPPSHQTAQRRQFPPHGVKPAALLLVAATLLGVSTLASAVKPNCKHLAAAGQAQVQLKTHPTPKSEKFVSVHPVRDAEYVISGTYGESRDGIQKRVPGLYDWAVLTLLRGWEKGITADQMQAYLYKECMAELF